MRVVEGDRFTTELTTHGILPSLPTVDSADHQRLRALIDAELHASDPWKGASDTYWTGKALGRLAQLVPIADSIGYTAGRDALLDLLKNKMEDWLTADGPGDNAQFYYDDQWDTLIGFPASFGSNTELNDHDFHYGYFITPQPPSPARPVLDRRERWGPMVTTVLRTPTAPTATTNASPGCGPSPLRGTAGLPGTPGSPPATTGVLVRSHALCGQRCPARLLIGDEELRDLGVYLHTTQASAMRRYWQNADGDAFPAGYSHDVVGMVWSDGGDHRIWWDGTPEELYGINYLPITAGSLYLGHDPEHAAAMHQSLVTRLGRQPQVWRDIHWAHQALSDPDAALAAFEAQWQSYEPESGSSKAHTYQWLSTLAEFGTVDTSVTADTPHYAVFRDGDRRTYVAFNPTGQPLTVTFSDGTTLTVPPGQLATG